MSKPKRKNSDETKFDLEGRVIITTSRGHQVECQPIAAMIDELQATYGDKMPSPPEHILTDVAGVSVSIPYTEEAIKQSSVPEGDKAAWEKYRADKAALETELNERRLRLIATKGIKVLDMPENDDWVEEHKWLGYDVPDNPPQRLYHYVKTEVLGTQEDGLKVTAGIYRASGIDAGVLKQIEDSFRASMGRREGQDAGTSSDDSSADEQGQAAGLVEQPDLHD